ncbi:MAG: N-acetylneuraminate synthase family protein, partial [Deferribacteraceae bacterium]|nr:N-acetylneuraminate synthase family protein [Deferribacteraceae bacterium]
MNIKIGNHTIGDNCPIFLIAELSANHQHDIEIARRSIIAAKEAGADAVKLQTYTADTITIDCDSPLFKLPDNTLWTGKTLYQLYQEAYTPWEWHRELKELANSLGMELFSSPFDPTASTFLHNLDMP